LSPVVPVQSRSVSGHLIASSAILAATATLRELVFGTAVVAQFVQGPEGLVRVSPSTAALLGLTESDLPDVSAALSALLTPILTAASAGPPWESYDLEADAPGRDGVLRRLRISARQVPRHEGWIVGIIEPIGTPEADLEDRYRQLLELSPDALIVHEAGMIVYANPAAVSFARGHSLPDLLGRPIFSFVAPESQPELLSRLSGLTHPGAVSDPSETIFIRLDGTRLVMEATSVQTSWNGRSAFQVIMRDLTEHRAAEAVIEQQAMLVEHVSDAIIATGADGLIRTWNPAAHRSFGWTAEEAIGRSMGDLFGAAGADLVAGAAGGVRLETRLARRNGQVLDVELAIDDVLDPTGAPDGQVMVCSDITERRQSETERELSEARLLHQSRHDALTGLANRAMVLEHLGDALLRHAADPVPPAGQVAVLFLDLDRFKLVNDSLGHAAGDEVLRIVGRRLAGAVRSNDLVGRLAGDEFVVLIDDLLGPDELNRLVERVFAAMAEPLTVNGRRLTITASIGIAELDPAERNGAEELLRDADVAMYTAKQSGRSRAVRFDAQLRSRARHSLEFEEDLRLAVAADEITVAYQPLIELATGRVAATEALARWTHRTRGDMSPALFIPVAEDIGLIGRLGASVLHDACSRTAAWRAGGLSDLRVSVNLSGHQLADPYLVPDVIATLGACALPAEAVSLEITESVLMTDPEAAARTLRALADIGVGLSVDDFGTGYSSLSYLRQFPVDTIKIDRSFVADITRDSADLAIVDSVIGLAHRLNLRTVAEGAETAEQVEVLRELGCHQIQGFWFSRPLTPDAVPGFVLPRR
jgi:diguanylate cyclase (GGDEF)-like protein/PAS domain S-box-containing protein